MPPSPVFALATLCYLTARANNLAMTALRAAADHVEATPLDALRPDDEFLVALTEWSVMEEDRLMGEVEAYMLATAKQRTRDDAGSFDRTWTFAPSSRETAGIGAA